MDIGLRYLVITAYGKKPLTPHSHIKHLENTLIWFLCMQEPCLYQKS
jgi:hypothetical protein